MRFALLALAGLMLAGCASLGELHAARHCGHAGEAGWRIIEAPADADAYRTIARADADRSAAAAQGREFWFARDGVTKYCVVDPRPSSCETLQGTWWEFTRTADGLSAGPAGYGVCLT